MVLKEQRLLCEHTNDLCSLIGPESKTLNMANMTEKDLTENLLFELFVLFYFRIFNDLWFRNFVEMLPRV